MTTTSRATCGGRPWPATVRPSRRHNHSPSRGGRESPDIVHAGSCVLVEEVSKVSRELVFRNELWYHDARLAELAVRADGIDPPEVPVAPDREDAAEDIEANQRPAGATLTGLGHRA